MYEPHFGLTSDPFRLSPSSRACFEHRTFKRALAYLSYAVGRRDGILMLTGVPGTGKSSVLRAFTTAVSDPSIAIEHLVCSSLDGDDLLRAVAQRFGVDVEGAKRAEIYERLQSRLAAIREGGRRSLLIIDEAQGLTRDALEEVRLLTNFQRGDDVLLQVFLVGQPELKARVRAPGLEQLHQRLIVACTLNMLEEAEVRPYIEHCLHESGWRGTPSFDDAIFADLHGETHGVPRRINLIMSRLMLHAMVQNMDHVTDQAMGVVLEGLRKEGLLVSQSWKAHHDAETESDEVSDD